jgi:polyhydroxyalkanoate synthesis regulator phasin
LKRVALFTSGVAELTRNRAEQIVKDLVGSGDVRRDKASSAVRDLLSVSKQSRQELLRMIRTEISNQMMSLGVASARDIERLERRVARLEASAGRSPGKKTTARKSTAKKTTSRKTTSTRTAAKPAGSTDSTS